MNYQEMLSIISKPWVILMDEPSTGMDPYTRSLLMQFLHRAYLKAYKTISIPLICFKFNI